LANITNKRLVEENYNSLPDTIKEKYSKCAGNQDTYIILHPNILPQMAILSGVSTKAPIIISPKINTNNENEFYSQYYNADKTITIVTTKNGEWQNVGLTVFHNLEKDDIKLFLATLRFCSIDSIKNKMIRVYFKDMAEHLNEPLNQDTYNSIKERYKKLFYNEFEMKYSKGRKNIEYKICFFQYINFSINDIYPDDSYVDVQLSDFIAQQLIDLYTANIYRNELMPFTNPVSKIVTFLLQQDRLYCYIYNQDYKEIYSYRYFTSNVLFPPRNSKNQNIKMIIDAFEEIRKQNIIVNSVEYNPKKQVFYVQFTPLDDREFQYFTCTNLFEKLQILN